MIFVSVWRRSLLRKNLLSISSIYFKYLAIYLKRNPSNYLLLYLVINSSNFCHIIKDSQLDSTFIEIKRKENFRAFLCRVHTHYIKLFVLEEIRKQFERWKKRTKEYDDNIKYRITHLKNFFVYIYIVITFIISLF